MKRAIVIVGSLFAACGGRTENPLPITTDAATDASAPVEAAVITQTATLVAECGPADGIAFAIVVAPSATCDPPSTVVDLGTTMHFYGATLPENIGTFPIGDGTPTAGSGATVCDSSGCLAAASGTITITNQQWFEAFITEVSGYYTLTLSDGTTRAGAFVAECCHNGIQCG
jgi:hypothetical protein